MNRALGIALLAVFSAATPGRSQATPEVAEFLRQTADARAANGATLLQYSWTQSTEIVLDGDSKGAIFQLVRFDWDGRMQRTTLGVEEEGRLRLRPRDTGRRVAGAAIGFTGETLSAGFSIRGLVSGGRIRERGGCIDPP